MRDRTRAERRENTEKIIKRQSRIQGRTGLNFEEPHRFAKRHAMDCGTPGCHMCGNRRQFDGESIQELSFNQTENWVEP